MPDVSESNREGDRENGGDRPSKRLASTLVGRDVLNTVRLRFPTISMLRSQLVFTFLHVVRP